MIILDKSGYFFARANNRTASLDSRTNLIGKVVSRPEINSNRTEFLLRVDTIDTTRHRHIPIKLLARCYQNPDIISYDTLTVFSTLKVKGKLKNYTSTNPAQFDYRKYLRQRSIYGIFIIDEFEVISREKIPVWYKIIYWLQDNMVESLEDNLPQKETGVLKRMFVGVKGDLDSELRDIFIDAGVMHVLVVSGLHVGYVVCAFWFVLRFLPFYNMQIKYLLLIPPVAIYCLVTGANPPVMRATLIVVCLVLCYLLGREKVTYHAFSLAAFVILLIDPQALFGASFQLSFAACLGIIYISPKLMTIAKNVVARLGGLPVVARFIGQNKFVNIIIRWVTTLFFVSLSAQLATAPLLARYFYKLSAVAIISNLIVVPAVGIILWLCFMLFCSSLISNLALYLLPFLELPCSAVVKFSAYLCYISTHWLIKIVSFFASQPGAIVRTGEPSTVFIMVYYALLILIFKLQKNFHRMAVITAVIFVFIFTQSLNRRLKPATTISTISQSLSITFLDVGLGDAIFVKTSSGEKIFIDCGGDNLEIGDRVLVPFLWHQGITRIDKIFITTSKWTHYTGLKALLQEFQIKEILISDFTLDSELSQLLDYAIHKNIKITKLKPCDVIFLGESKLEIFYQPESECSIMKLSHNNLSVLLTSDISQEALNKVIEKHNITGVTILQYPSHGKKKISVQTLQKLNPEYIVVSTDYLPQALTRTVPQQVYSTSQHGAIKINSDGNITNLIPFVVD